MTLDADTMNKLFDFDYTIHIMDLDNIPEAVTPNEDGSYSIFINAKLSAERQQFEALHALFHILQEDFGKDNVQEIEVQAHKRETQNCELSDEISPVNAGLS